MYVDDVALIAEEKQEMKAMISGLGYLDKKGLELSPEKTKVMRFRKGSGRKKKLD